ncbi:hypothetical protein CRG98_012600 [Punica granatum]|uniref:Endonuclease/exonuclease/phosphatase domain-containing protein n=1 Tax=Punica granatum TaxID=22663 RepID=A0A2I0KEX3_PUNGR|nr:hypothetical protein CRG98_012600 [Punica granatum]
MEPANSLSTEESNQLRRRTKRTKRVRIDRSRQKEPNAVQRGTAPATTEGTEKGLATDKGKRKLSYSAVVAGDGKANMDIASEESIGEGIPVTKQAGVEMPVTKEIPMEIPEPSSEEEEADPGFEFSPNIRFSKEQLRHFHTPWWGSLIVKVDRETASSEIGNFARFCVEVNLNKRLKSRFTIHGEEYKAAFESIHLVCFQCGVMVTARKIALSLGRIGGASADPYANLSYAAGGHPLDDLSNGQNGSPMIHGGTRARVTVMERKVGRKKAMDHVAVRPQAQIQVGKPNGILKPSSSLGLRRTSDAQPKVLQVEKVSRQPRAETTKGSLPTRQAPELNPSAIFGNVPPFLQLQRSQVPKGADRAASEPPVQCEEGGSEERSITADLAPYPMVSGVSPLQTSLTPPAPGVAKSRVEFILVPIDIGSKPQGANIVEEIMVVDEATSATEVERTIADQVLHCRISQNARILEFAAVYASITGPWVVLGDFNDVPDASEKKVGVPFNPIPTAHFQEALGNWGLMDLESSGSRFTWLGPIHPGYERVFERLDRAASVEQVQVIKNVLDALCATSRKKELYMETLIRSKEASLGRLGDPYTGCGGLGLRRLRQANDAFLRLCGKDHKGSACSFGSPVTIGCLQTNTDGASKGNPSPAGAGGVLRKEDGVWITSFARHVGIAKAVVAEL